MPYLYLVPTPKDRNPPTVKCECGSEILLIPDIKEMSAAIENHVWEHVKNDNDLARAVQESNRLCDLLIAQIFALAFEAETIISN